MITPTPRTLGEIIGKISEVVGFEFEEIDILRERRATRHNIKLRESIVVMKKIRNV